MSMFSPNSYTEVPECAYGRVYCSLGLGLGTGLRSLSQLSETGIPDIGCQKSEQPLRLTQPSERLSFLFLLLIWFTEFSRLLDASLLDIRWAKGNVEASL